MSQRDHMREPLSASADLAASYTIERVDATDSEGLAAFLAVHQEAAAWLWERGVRQWRPGEYTMRDVRDVLASGGEVCLARRDGAPAGGFTLQRQDVGVWGERAPDAGYLHSLCVRRADAGTGLSAALLDYAARRVAATGRAWLRLDCWAGNEALRAFYERHGFSLHAVAKEDDYSIALYERAVGTARP